MKKEEIKNGMLVKIHREYLAMIIDRPLPERYKEDNCAFVFPLCETLRQGAKRYHPFYLAYLQVCSPYVPEE